MPRIDAIRSWLRESIALRSPPFANWILFGSSLKNSFSNDVDVMLVSAEWDVREICCQLKSEFRQRFGLPLHLQLFHISQSADIKAFIERAKLIDEAI